MIMRFYDCDYKLFLLMFFIFTQTSSQHYNRSDLPWQKLKLHQKNSDLEILGLTSLTLDKSDELVKLQAVRTYNGNLEKDSTFNMLEQWGNISTCHEVAKDLGNFSAQLISCFVQNARPITVCQNCVNEYINFDSVYKKICTSTGNKEMNECRHQLVNKDKLNVIQKTCDFASSLWMNAYCANCFVKVNNSVTTELNNETKHFLSLSEAVDKCFQDSLYEVHSGTVPKNESVCSLCRKVYDAVHNDYKKLKKSYQDSICMDLTDIMNTTSDLWNDHYNCIIKIPSSPYVYIMATIFVILVPSFYSGFRFIARPDNTRIIGQKRFVTRHRNSISYSGQQQMNSFHSSHH